MTKVWWGLLAAALIGFSALFVWQTVHSPSKKTLPVLGEVADFTLTDHYDRPVSRQDLLGKVWIADFIYTTCPDQCPMMSRRMQVLQGLLPKESSVKLVSISVDPKRDTPRALSAYAKKYHAEESRWRFLTGKQEMINVLVRCFNVVVKREGPASPRVDHSDQLILVDTKARIRGYYGGTDETELHRLIKDISQIDSTQAVL